MTPLNKLEEPLTQYVGSVVDFSPVPDGIHTVDWTRGKIIGVEEATSYILIERADDHSTTLIPPFAANFVFFA